MITATRIPMQAMELSFSMPKSQCLCFSTFRNLQIIFPWRNY